MFDCLCLLWATGALGSSGLETVLELAVDGLKVTHAAGTGGSSSEGLLTPVICRVVCHVSKRSPMVPPGCNGVLVWGYMIPVGDTYICASWQLGNRTKRMCASGCGGIAGLYVPSAVRFFCFLIVAIPASIPISLAVALGALIFVWH